MHIPGEVSNLGPERHGKVVEGGVPKTRRAQRLGFGGAQVGDGELVLMAPFDKGRLGHLKFVGDLIKAASL